MLHDKITSQPYKSLILGPALREMIMYGVFVEQYDLQNSTVKWFRKCLSIILGGSLQDIKVPSLQDEKDKMNYINEICDDFMNRSNLNQDFIRSVFQD